MVPLLEKIGAAFAEYVFFISLYQKKKKKKIRNILCSHGRQQYILYKNTKSMLTISPSVLIKSKGIWTA